MLNWFPCVSFFLKTLPSDAVLDLSSHAATVENLLYHKEQFILLILIDVHLVFGAFPKRLEERGVNDFV